MTRFLDDRTNALNAAEALLLKEAKAICRGQQTGDPDLPELLHLRALLALRNGQNAVAVACARRATSSPAQSSAACHSDLGEILRLLGRGDEAEQEQRRALALRRDDPLLLCRLARALGQQGRYSTAIATYREALALQPDRVATHLDLGSAYEAQGNLASALSHYQRALALDSTEPAAYAALGTVQLRLEDWTAAHETFRAGLRVSPSDVGLHIGLGRALLRLRRTEDALASFAAALAINPRDLTACRYIVCLLERSGRTDAAELASAWYCLGAALEHRSRLKEAGIAYRRAAAYEPDCLRALFGAGTVHLQLAEYRKASPYFEAILARRHEHPQARLNRGWVRQMLGDLECGWKDLASYDRLGDGRRRYFEQPAWDGRPLADGTILLWSDQAIGDSIQNIRFVQHVRARTARVIVQCARRLMPLIERMPGVDEVVTRAAPLPSFDAHSPLTHLARLFGTRLTTIPNDVPYLSVEQALIDEWRERLGSAYDLNVGLVWGGDPGRKNASARFTSLVTFSPLAGVPNVRFVSLQQGPPSIELLAPPSGMRIEVFAEESRSMLDTAALVLNLDLVITVDTMIAHLAGALARPVWTLLPYAPDWRWLERGRNSAWYPTMRLFRQTAPGSWGEVLQQVRFSLEHFLALSPEDTTRLRVGP